MKKNLHFTLDKQAKKKKEIPPEIVNRGSTDSSALLSSRDLTYKIISWSLKLSFNCVIGKCLWIPNPHMNF